jgi:trigger factor
LNIEVVELEGCERQLNISIPADIVGREVERAAGEMAHIARVPGFRPGHTPRSVIKQRYRSELRQEALRQLLPSAVETAVETHKLRVVGEPEVDRLEFGEDGSLKVTVRIEVLPDFTPNYRGIKVTRTVYRITEGVVDKYIEGLLDEAAQLVPIDDADHQAVEGDIVVVDIEGHEVESESPREPLSVTDLSIEVGSATVQPEFSENLRGVKAGDERTFRVHYPENFSAADMAGRTIEYQAKVVAIRRKEVPAFDDQFVAEYGEGEYESTAQLRDALRRRLERDAESRTERELQEALASELLKLNEFPVPKVMADMQAHQRLSGIASYLKSRGLNARDMALDWESLLASQRGKAEEQVRIALVLDRIADDEGIEVSDEEVEAEVHRIAEAVRQPVPQVRARLTKEGGADSIRDRIRSRKTLDLVVQAAEVAVREVEGLEAAEGARAAHDDDSAEQS